MLLVEGLTFVDGFGGKGAFIDIGDQSAHYLELVAVEAFPNAVVWACERLCFVEADMAVAAKALEEGIHTLNAHGGGSVGLLLTGLGWVIWRAELQVRRMPNASVYRNDERCVA